MIRHAAIVALCAAVAACGSSATERRAPQDASGQGGPSVQFLDLIAPVDGDAGARAGESAGLLLARTEEEAATTCMEQAGFGGNVDLPVLRAQDVNALQPEMVSPAKLEARGLVAVVGTARAAPPAAQTALDTCLGASGGHTVSPATDRFLIFRNGTENPFASWSDTYRTEVARLAASDAADTHDYRECFQQLGVPAETARNPSDTLSWLIGEMNNQTSDFSDARVAAWESRDGVLDADSGALAKGAAACFREVEPLLTPTLAKRRQEVVDGHRDQLVAGERLFRAAIGSQPFDPDTYSF